MSQCVKHEANIKSNCLANILSFVIQNLTQYIHRTMASPIKECEWKHDVNRFAREKVVRHVELFDKPSHGSVNG